MKSDEIRSVFLKYFEERGHKILPSAPLVPGDPTVLLTLAGMLPFKPIFLGEIKPQFKRVATAQKCLRMNDIENVGRTSRHHTFFEMLGNFSFGDYFKKEAVDLAWDLLTKIYNLPPEKLVAAVYEKDDETFGIWKNKLDQSRIYRLGEENNFWAVGPTGPCGPCSEIYYDYGHQKGCGKPDCKPGCDCERFLEIWNLVFIEYNRDKDGKLIPLPSKNIDTGMGLERIARLLQNVETNFECDLFVPILSKLPPGSEVSRRIVADHIRAATYLIADNVLPGNEGRSYVLRRIIRRALLHGQKLGVKETFLPQLAEIVIDLGKANYPELCGRSKTIFEALKNEEESFNLTIGSGMKLLSEMILKYGKALPGEDVFKLHDTYGFPMELTREIAAERGASIDEAGYNAAMEAQRSRARASLIAKDIGLKMDLGKLKKTDFIGYDKFECDAKIAVLNKDEKIVILDKTPFYPESGGQVGDTGLMSVNGKEILVKNTFGQIGGIIFHEMDNMEGLKEKQSVKVKINSSRRAAIAAHHTATHLLHAALRSVLGPDAKQQGSLVAPDRLRFDFSHSRPLTILEIEQIEKIVNENIKNKIKVEAFETSTEAAIKMGAVALFGEKYGKRVRVIKIDLVSLELCGGSHVKNTGEICFFKICREESLQAGIRRIEAVAGPAAKIYLIYQGKSLRDIVLKLIKNHRTLQEEFEKLGGKLRLEPGIFEIDQEEIVRLGKAVDAQDIVNVNKFLEHLRGRVDWLNERNKNLTKEIEKLRGQKALGMSGDLAKEIREIKGVKVLLKELRDLSMSNLRDLSDKIRKEMGSGIIILALTSEEKVSFLATISDDLVERYDAGNLVKVVSEITGGKGGGKRNKAEGGGHDTSKINEAFAKLLDVL